MTENDWLKMVTYNRRLGVRVGFACGFVPMAILLALVVWLMS